ncbi:hypothetical protein QQF64_034175 [Cirrhinus molitorella]|uniref:Peptidase A2 domain-containing protein n=1 Tax=Cirrhinus molitorella TaxID=172907 RepID=A0ABR3MW09_9TELE
MDDAQDEVNIGGGRGQFFRDMAQTSGAMGITDSPVFSSTRIKTDRQVPNSDTTSTDLSYLITQLAHEIGQSISAQLKKTNEKEGIVTNSQSVGLEPPSADSHSLTMTGVKLVMQSDVKEPPSFRGDGTDKLSIHESEGQIDVYLRKRGVPTGEHAQEMMSRLGGRARDIIKVTLRSNPSLKPGEDPRVIIDILKQHFRELTYSAMPPADFYSTLPTVGENAMDYWIHLNKAVDVAEDCLKRQRRNLEDPSKEVTMMFVKQCPDPALSAVLKFKTADKWKARIQERLDDHQTQLRIQQQRARSRRSGVERYATVNVQAAAIDKSTQDIGRESVASQYLEPVVLVCIQARAAIIKLTDLHMERGCAGGQNQPSTKKMLTGSYVIVNKTFRVKRMLDSGSMTCTVNEDTASRMLEENIITKEKELSEQVILIGCGGHQTHPKCAYKVEIEVYGIQYTVPILVIPGQKDDLILGSNVKKYLMHEMKGSNDYWRLTAQNCDMSESPDTSQFLDMMAGVTRWQGAEIPSKIRTVKLTQAVTLLARHEHLLWGRLPKNTLMSPGSTVIVEPTSSKSMPQNILVGQVITPMWGDGYIPMKIMNLSDQPVTLKRNCKLADVSPVWLLKISRSSRTPVRLRHGSSSSLS